MRTTYDAAYIHLTIDTEPGRSVRKLEVEHLVGGLVVLDFDRKDVLLGVEVLGVSRVLDASFINTTERLDR